MYVAYMKFEALLGTSPLAASEEEVVSDKIMRSLELCGHEDHEAWQTRAQAGRLLIRTVPLDHS